SQAGRRGFESHLPLHLFYLTHSASSRFTSFTSKPRFACRTGGSSPLCWLAVGQSKLQLGNRFQSAFKIALGIRVDGDPDRVPAAQRRNFSRPHPNQNGKQENDPFPQIQYGQCQPDLLFGQRTFAAVLASFGVTSEPAG